MASEFVGFSESLSEELLDSFTKDQLVAVAEFYQIPITGADKRLKETVLKAVKIGLVEQGVIGSVSKLSSPPSVEESLHSAGSVEAEMRLKEMSLQEKRMQLDAAKLRAEREVWALRERELEHQLQMQKLEHELKLKMWEGEEQEREHQHELELKRVELELASKYAHSSPSSDPSPLAFDVGWHIRMVPPFSEKEVEKYFNHFERGATTLKWPEDVWTLLLQCVLVGKAQEVYSSLTVQQSSDYALVKTAIMNAYELVPEAYRQKFRKFTKTDQITFVEFTREKETLFDRWCVSSKVTTWDQLRELILFEEFKNCIPEAVATHLNDQKVSKLAQAAVCVDEYSLTHKIVFSQSQKKDYGEGVWGGRTYSRSPPSSPRGSRACFYCHETGHLIADCPTLKKKNTQRGPAPKGVIYGTPPRPDADSRSHRSDAVKDGVLRRGGGGRREGD
ncbi:uncharacterized protein LOC114784568 [Denticeps clupeoides]|uniref:uncharacterized protein LOC114784568 n=1 Tax=Denticeps clupeoides TaxID=299321 RepID=UPI0010A48ECD|nr:uncharacterized protein LOC114784568 [Denticeps clupeoides]